MKKTIIFIFILICFLLLYFRIGNYHFSVQNLLYDIVKVNSEGNILNYESVVINENKSYFMALTDTSDFILVKASKRYKILWYIEFFSVYDREMGGKYDGLMNFMFREENDWIILGTCINEIVYVRFTFIDGKILEIPVKSQFYSIKNTGIDFNTKYILKIEGIDKDNNIIWRD